MNSLSKAMCAIVGVAVTLWGGAQFLNQESHRDRGVSHSQPQENVKTRDAFQQEIGALRDRLAQVEEAQPDLERLQGQLNQLEYGQQNLRAELQTARPQDAGFAREEELASLAPEQTPAVGEREQKLFASFETQFLHESDNPTWSQQAEASLKQAVTNADFEGSYLLSADCRSTLCQMEVGHESDGARDGFVDHFPFTLPFDTEVFYYRIEDGKGLPYTVMYMARAGQRLPLLGE